ncbi:MAG: quercetin 2,3-dioxygenase [Actinomycetota bacterium]|jgi:redox-sensitive bicupin YhaK (pirin superfamily)
MSGPVTSADAPVAEATADTAASTAQVAGPRLEILPGRQAQVGTSTVSRVLPKRAHRTVGAWCFADHFGPAEITDGGVRIGPHPHMGLHTVTWLLDGEVLHRDSLGSEQLIRPGQLNLMTAGRGVAHAEQTPARTAGTMHGLQLWVAQPESTRFGDPAFEHHRELPRDEWGDVVATVLVGALGNASSPARADTPLLGADLDARGAGSIPLDPTFEHALVVASGALEVDGTMVHPGSLAYLGLGRDELLLGPASAGRALLLGGTPFGETVVMWWNFVGRSTDEVDAAYRDWEAKSERFGAVGSELARVGAPRPNWMPLP